MKNILIVKTSAIGDVTHTLPALDALHQHYPDAHIDWLVEEAAADLLRSHPYINRLLISKRKRWLSDWREGKKYQTFLEVKDFIKKLRATRYDLLIDFQGLLKSSMFIAVARATRKVGFGRGMDHQELSYLFLNERVPAVDMDIHAVDREKRLLEAIGVSEEGRYWLPVSEDEHKQADNLLRTHNIDSSKPLIIIHPMTTWPTKHWQDHKFTELADLLRKENMEIVFTGGKDNYPRIESIISSMKEKRAENFAGKTDLKTLAALFQCSRGIVTTDTGPMHIAATVGTPVVALFGPTAPWRTGPIGSEHRVVRSLAECSPCYKKKCVLSSTSCMKNIEVFDVFQELLKVSSKKTNLYLQQHSGSEVLLNSHDKTE